MEIKVTKQTEEIRNIELPLFFVSNDGDEYIGLFSEADYRKIRQMPKAVMVSKTYFLAGYDSNDLNNYLNPEMFTEISEQDFILQWDNVIRALMFNVHSETIPY